jgi:hypothetical protein
MLRVKWRPVTSVTPTIRKKGFTTRPVRNAPLFKFVPMEPDEDQYELSGVLPSHSHGRSRTRRHGGRLAHVLPRKVNDFLDRRLKGGGRTTVLVLLCILVLLFVFWPKPAPPPTLKSPPPGYDSDDPVWSTRAASVKDAFLHAYHGYESHTTFPDDELAPISNSGQRK